MLKSLGNSNTFPNSISYKLKNRTGDVISTTANVNFNYDSTEPSLSNIQFIGAFEKELQDGTEVYYLNNTNGKKYTISGIATDDTGIESVKLKISGKDDLVLRDGRFTFTDIDFTGLSPDANGGVTATLTVTDVAGNQTSKDLKVVFDTLPPVAEHQLDSKGKDLVLRIGDFDNDDIDSNNSLWTDELCLDVGKKYSANSYGNANTIQLRGNIKDEGSGVAMIYYKVFDSAPTQTQIDDFIANYKSDKIKTGYFAPLANPEEKLVFYNVQGSDSFGGTQLAGTTDKYYKTVTTNFKSSLSNFEEGKNYVVLVAEDNVGNVGADTTYYSINVDTAVPEITPDSDELLYSNGKTDITISGKITDKSGKAGEAGAGVDTDNLKIRIGNDENLIAVQKENIISTNNPADLNELSWTAIIPASRLNSLSGNVTIYAIAKDKAGSGNSTTPNIATIAIDKVAPTVKVNSPKDADSTTEGIQVNGIISLSGTVEEAKKLSDKAGDELKLFYTTNQTLGQKSANAITESDIGENAAAKFKQIAQSENSYNWNIENIDTSKLDGNTAIPDGTVVYLTVCSKDFAGNAGFSTPLKLTIDQDTDRPIIRLSNVLLSYKDENQIEQFMSSSKPVWLNRSEISGVVNDDDDSIEFVKVIAKASDEQAPSESEWENAQNIYQNGIWIYTFENNGQKKLYFQVKDGNKLFTSNEASSTASTFGPKIIDANSAKFGYKAATGITARPDDILYFKVDTDDPTLENPYYFTSSETVGAVNSITEWTQITSSIIPEQFGGIKKYLYIKYKATDTNGISAIDVKFAGISPVETVELSSNGQSKECISYFDISKDSCGVESGVANLSINVKDNAAANTGAAGITKNYEMTIDNKAPEIGFSNYSSGTQVYGSSAVSLRGSTSDKNEVTKVEYALSKTSTKPASDSEAWKVITQEDGVAKDSYTSALSWQIVFDGKTTLSDESSYHAELLKNSVFAQQMNLEIRKSILEHSI